MRGKAGRTAGPGYGKRRRAGRQRRSELGFASTAVILLLAFMWFMLLHGGLGKPEQAKHLDDVDSTIIENAWVPFALIPDLVHEDDDAGAVSAIIAGTLAAQKAFISADTGTLPGRARDKFSVGYIGGYVDAVLRRKRVATMRTKYTVGELVFADIFGTDDGFSLYENYVSLQNESDSDLFAGMAAGETDIEEWYRNNLNSPFGWSVYVHDNPETS